MRKRDFQKEKRNNIARRKRRVRARIFGTSKKPRLSIFRSNSHIWCQLINDEKEQTLLAATDKDLRSKDKTKKSKTKLAHEVGKLIAQKAIKEGIKLVVFDRDGYKYHGRVRSFAEGARTGGLKF